LLPLPPRPRLSPDLTTTGTYGACVWAFDGQTLVIVHLDKIDGTRAQRRAA
jgi:hypothetical protein